MVECRIIEIVIAKRGRNNIKTCAIGKFGSDHPIKFFYRIFGWTSSVLSNQYFAFGAVPTSLPGQLAPLRLSKTYHGNHLHSHCCQNQQYPFLPRTWLFSRILSKAETFRNGKILHRAGQSAFFPVKSFIV